MHYFFLSQYGTKVLPSLHHSLQVKIHHQVDNCQQDCVACSTTTAMTVEIAIHSDLNAGNVLDLWNLCQGKLVNSKN